MHDKVNFKINQVTEDTLIIGVDIAKKKHYACAIDNRGKELKKVFPFNQSYGGFEKLVKTISSLKTKHQKTKVIIGFEATGHYWKNLAERLWNEQLLYVIVNPLHVKHSKEFEDNIQSKNDKKDARLIARLVENGYYTFHRFLEGIEAELRECATWRRALIDERASLKNKLINWTDQYFPEFPEVFKDWGVQARTVLRYTPFPQDLQVRSLEECMALYQEDEGARFLSRNKIAQLKEWGSSSIGCTQGQDMAYFKLVTLIDQYALLEKQIQEIEEKLCFYARQLFDFEWITSIRGVSEMQAAELLAETGPLSQYDHPRQLIKLAGLTLRDNSSGNREGEKRLSKRGRKALRALLFRMITTILPNNDAFKDLYQYYVNRPDNPLKKKEAKVALCRKVLQVVYGMSKHQRPFDADRMRRDLSSHLPVKLAA
ncbi:IS110 family transposase [Alteribacillus sp. JSM 102045]|uniref:IS110 family transposase n=1 Tax=Alteribacillus sp. JSM 102045 TaxID=1562101 RepID=UPI0035C22DFB